ncbi:MAG: disulfide bond formation protein B [Paracoccaceae bacterium]
MTRRTLILLAAGGSLALLLGALGFQYLGALAPCKLCLWQRWPHGAAILIGALALATRGPALPALGSVAALSTAAIGAYHTGVERKWWAGPSSCTGDGGALSGLSGGDLLNFDAPTDIVMCDVVPWEMFGLSMASYNALASLLFAGLWLMAARAR